jgi:diguanylate cyclase (GGDEF)-like protein/PAS domain S-box-containing protein
MRKSWVLYPLAGAVAALLYLFLRPVNVGPVFNIIGLSSPVAIVIGVRIRRPEVRLPWYLFAAGQALFVAGDIIAYNYERFFHSPLPFPAISDALYLSVYPCLVAGLLLLIHSRNPGRDRASLIDSLIITIGIGTLFWVFLIAPYARATDLTVLQKLVAMGYPLMDLMLLAVTVRLAVGGGKRVPAFYLLVASVVSLLVADSIYGWLLLHNGYETGGLLDAGWIAFYLLWGAAALHPSMRTLSEPAPDHETTLGRRRLVLLTTASLMAPAVLVVQAIRHEPLDVGVVIGASVVLFLLVILRMYGLVHKQEQFVARERALRRAGASLVTATSKESIYEAALDAVRALTGNVVSVRVLVTDDVEHSFSLVASGGGVDPAEPRPLQLSRLAGDRQEALLRQRSVLSPRADSIIGNHVGFGLDVESVFTVPLFIKDELRGLLVIGSPGPLPRAIRDGLEALASQVALALESAMLTEDLLRQQSEARFSSLVQNSSDVVAVIEPDTTIRYVSPSVERVTGFKWGDVDGTRFSDLIHPDDRSRVLGFLTNSSRSSIGHPGLMEFRLRHRNGSSIAVETLRTNLMDDPNVAGIVINVRDISERKEFEEQLAHQAFHDTVTGLANRALFRDRVEHALARLAREDEHTAVLFMDLDDFKTINDSLGHAAGDQLLTDVGLRLQETLRSVDTAARLGGDEFAILLEDVGVGVQAAEVAERILESLNAPFELDGKEVFVRASIGIATDDGSDAVADADEVLRNADVAMYMAKERGKNRYQVFEPAMHSVALKRLELKADLQRAVEHEEFVLHYQPVVALQSGRVTGVEALIRWQHPEAGLIPPLEFIPLAEETGLIIPIGKWAFEEACREAKRLQSAYPTDQPFHMAVNISARQLQRSEIVQEVAEVLHKTGLDPGTLVIEITESVMMADMELSIRRLSELKELGVRLAVDDFGTGYSSLNYIRRFPVDILKVDKSFIDGVAEAGEASALTAAVIELAAILKLTPVAEGIERSEQLDRLLELECDLGQGFLFARPLDADSLRGLLTERIEIDQALETPSA